MSNGIRLRPFEERDVDFIYKSKLSKRINQTIIGDYTNFTYEDAVNWVEGCMKEDAGYKFWAICTNDDFENIVGWCSISNIDKRNKKASLHGITINDSRYNDGLTCFDVFLRMAEYVFHTLAFNRFYTMCIVSNKFSMTIGKTFFNCSEGVLKQAVYKDGQYHDIAIFALLKESYDKFKSEGLLAPQVLWNDFKGALKPYNDKFLSKEDFVASFAKIVQYTEDCDITPMTKFRELDEWSSLYAIEFIAMLEDNFKISLDIHELNECETFSDVYDYVSAKSTTSQSLDIDNLEFEDKHSEPF